ncbi:MAG TPA: DNA primase [Azospirillaceae bacterium]|nr:DNA primase [Azospirillaceae bacterium]
MALPPQFLDELRARLPLSDIVMKRMRLIRAGREFKAPCPFHNEKTPSFYVNDGKGFFHCLAGETPVVLWEGVRPIRELAGTTRKVLSRGGRWIDAAFKSYGIQRLHRVTLTRNGQTKTLFATAGHRWFVRGVTGAVTTDRLRTGHRLESVLPEGRTDWTLDSAGVAHGVVFGDGSVQKGYGHVHLHGDKDRVLAKWFPDHPAVEKRRETGEPYLRVYGGRAFGHMKELPSLDRPDAYLLGFLAGYLAADGHVAKDGTVMLHSAVRANLEWVRTAATRLGIGTYGITTAVRRGLAKTDREIFRLHFVPATLDAALFLGDTARGRFAASAKAFARLRWVVASVEESDRVEEVYCAEVPEEHAFALEDNILTGNCFGCGAHGDVIAFVMRHDNLSFMEAVDILAGEAGMPVPQATPQERQKFERQKSLYDLVERAARWYEEQLFQPQGRQALAYLRGRGLNEEAIARFRLGYAPSDGAPLRAELAKAGYGDADLVEVGLFRRPDDGRSPFAFFRNRVMFPVSDRRGRVVAFGGRIMEGEGPKYVNSSDNPLFHKGQLLYGMSRARQAAADGQTLIVTEGYMDVIACVLAGFEGAVAPLGTAMTETQIQVLWKLAPEGNRTPILCFDGDNAGRRAAARAVERLLPLLVPDHSVRVAFMPEKEDPDSLIRAGGASAFQAVLDRAKPLADVLWEMEAQGRDLASPDARAGLEAALQARFRVIPDERVRRAYERDLKDRLYRLGRPERGAGRAGGQGGAPGQGGGRWQKQGDMPVSRLWDPAKHRSGMLKTPQLRERLLLLIPINHPALLEEVAEKLAAMSFSSEPHERLRQELVSLPVANSTLDADEIRRHLSSRGFAETLDTLLIADAPRYAQPEASTEAARSGWQEVWLNSQDLVFQAELKAAEARFLADFSEENLARLNALRREALERWGHSVDPDGLE